MLGIASLVVASSLALGQAEPAQTPLQEYGELIVGRWVGDVTLVADWPGTGKKGDKVIGYFSVRWIADRKGLEDEGFCGQGTGKSIYFWDPAIKKIRQSGVDSGGTVWEWCIWKENGTWVFEGGSCLSDGSRCELKGKALFQDNGNTLIYEGTGTLNGEKMLDLHDVYRRASN